MILVGHYYGGMVITEKPAGDNPKVRSSGLSRGICPEVGESASTLSEAPVPPGEHKGPLVTEAQFSSSIASNFPTSFAADSRPATTRFRDRGASCRWTVGGADQGRTRAPGRRSRPLHGDDGGSIIPPSLLAHYGQALGRKVTEISTRGDAGASARSRGVHQKRRRYLRGRLEVLGRTAEGFLDAAHKDSQYGLKTILPSKPASAPRRSATCSATSRSRKRWRRWRPPGTTASAISTTRRSTARASPRSAWGEALAGKPRDQYVDQHQGRPRDPRRDRGRQRPRPSARRATVFEHGRPNRIVNDYSADATLRSIEDSLKRLKTDRIDIAWVHDVAQDFYGDDWLGGVRERAQGRVQGARPAARRGRDQGLGPGRQPRRADRAAARARRAPAPTASCSPAATRCSTTTARCSA